MDIWENGPAGCGGVIRIRRGSSPRSSGSRKSKGYKKTGWAAVGWRRK